MLPQGLAADVEQTLTNLGDNSGLRSVAPSGGGCVNQAARISTGQSDYFIKWNSRPAAEMFVIEARGLKLLAKTQTIRVPEVLAVGEGTQLKAAFLLLEWVGEGSGRSSRPDQETLGRKLAELHQAAAPLQYGLDHDNLIGRTAQLNGWEEDWVTFFQEKRLLSQIEMAARRGDLSPSEVKKAENLLKKLPELLGGVRRNPSLIHGDLWGGNVISGKGGEPVLIDPAVYYADREAEIAFTELFGGFNSAFYAAYNEVWPLEKGYKQRRDLYNLYHVINHLNLFGGRYHYQALAIINEYL